MRRSASVLEIHVTSVELIKAVYSFPIDKFQTLLKLKEFADGNFKFDKNDKVL